VTGEFAWVARYGAQPPDPDTRSRLRSDLGIDKDAVAIAPIFDDFTPPDARRAVFYAGVIDFLRQPCVLVLPHHATRQTEAARFVEATGVHVTIAPAASPIVRLWPALDIVFEMEHALRKHDGTPSLAALQSWAEACRVVMRMCEPRKPSGTTIPAIADTLWWASGLPDRVRDA
jgi:hypothetical protein